MNHRLIPLVWVALGALLTLACEAEPDAEPDGDPGATDAMPADVGDSGPAAGPGCEPGDDPAVRCTKVCDWIGTCAVSGACPAAGAADRGDAEALCAATCAASEAFGTLMCGQNDCGDAVRTLSGTNGDFEALCSGGVERDAGPEEDAGPVVDAGPEEDAGPVVDAGADVEVDMWIDQCDQAQPEGGPMCPGAPPEARCAAACSWIARCAVSRDYCPNLCPSDIDRVEGNCLARCAENGLLATVVCGHQTCEQTISGTTAASPDFAADCEGM